MAFAEETSRCRAAQRWWCRLSVWHRLRTLRHFRNLLAAESERLALTVTQDVGRNSDEVLATEILPVADACRFLERHAAGILKPRSVPMRHRPLWLLGSRDQVQRRPHGVVGVIGTWNYPFYLNAVPIAQALAAGNGVLWKPSELAPASALALHEFFREAGVPNDLLIRLPATREAGTQLAEAEIDHVVFTGSAAVGRQVASRLGQRLISSTLELSGCDSMMIFADADLELAADAAWFGLTLNAGQTCLAVRRILVERRAAADFAERLRSRRLRDDSPRPLALMFQAAQAERLVGEALARGATLLGTEKFPHAEDDPPRFPPTIVINATSDMAIAREASFAPIAAVIPFDGETELLESQKACPYALGASIFTRDHARALRLARQLDTGSVIINDVLAATAHPATPFGGNRDSGWGVTQGAEGLLAMTVPRVVSIRKGRYRPHYRLGEDMATLSMLRGMLQWRHAQRWRDRIAGFCRMLRALCLGR